MACEDQSGMDREDERTGDRGSDRGIFETYFALCRGCRRRFEGRSRSFIAGGWRAAEAEKRAAQAVSPPFSGKTIFVRRAVSVFAACARERYPAAIRHLG